MAVLDSVSAISLDEFWSNDKKWHIFSIIGQTEYQSIAIYEMYGSEWTLQRQWTSYDCAA